VGYYVVAGVNGSPHFNQDLTILFLRLGNTLERIGEHEAKEK
jgi:hypothetical protein